MRVVFRPQAYQKLRAYVMGIDFEISGFGKITKEKDMLIIEDIRIFEQEVTAGSTVLDARGSAKFFDDLIVAGEDIGKWKLWWHSHVYMQAFFSETDIATMGDFDSEMSDDNWMLSIVVNKLGKMSCRVDIFQPLRCAISPIPYEVEIGEIVPVDVSEEIKEKVKITTMNYTDEKEDVITWLAPRVPWMLNGKVLTPQERISMMDRMNYSWPPQDSHHGSGEIIDGEIIENNGQTASSGSMAQE